MIVGRPHTRTSLFMCRQHNIFSERELLKKRCIQRNGECRRDEMELFLLGFALGALLVLTLPALLGRLDQSELDQLTKHW